MASVDDLLGVWGPDLVRWRKVEPKLAKYGFLLKWILGDLRVTFTGATLTIEGYGAATPRHFTFTVESEADRQIVLEVVKAGQMGCYVIEVIDDDHIVMRLKKPKEDVMALRRLEPLIEARR